MSHQRVSQLTQRLSQKLSQRRVQQGIVLGLLLIAISVVIFLVPTGETGPLRTEKVALQDFPQGIGRGFPLVALDQIQEGPTTLAVGETAPDFQLVLDDGRYLHLADLAGRPVLVNFWATWCGPCRLEMPEIVAEANRNEDLVVLAVNVQEELERLSPFAEDFQMTLPVLRDEDGDLRDRYGVRGMPTTVFIDREGIVTRAWTGLLTPSALQEFVAEID